MKIFLSFLIVVLFLTGPTYGDELTPEEAASKLLPSVGILKQNNNPICTAWKLSRKTWATAWHCVSMTGKEYKIETNEKPYSKTAFVRSLTLPTERGEGKNHWEDWATLRVTETIGIPNLEIDCEYKPALGERVAYVGFPNAGGPFLLFSIGHIANIESSRDYPFNFSANLQGGGGASGSPVMAIKTGKIIGFVTRGIRGSMGVMSAGIEGVAGMDRCEMIREAKNLRDSRYGNDLGLFSPF